MSYASIATVTPCVLSSAGLRAAARSLPAPLDAIPYVLRFLMVWAIPALPASPMWLLARPTQSMPAFARPLISFGSAEKRVPEVW